MTTTDTPLPRLGYYRLKYWIDVIDSSDDLPTFLDLVRKAVATHDPFLLTVCTDDADGDGDGIPEDAWCDIQDALAGRAP